MEISPLVSIIIPTYNRAHLIGETLDSVLAQTYQNWECIIVDDGSSDHTDEVVGIYVKKDPRFKYLLRPDEHLPGGNGARNYGFKKSQGEYVNWFDSDDLMSPKKIETDIEMLESGNYDFTISQSEYFSKNSTIAEKKYWNNNLWSNNPINDFITKDIGWSFIAPIWKKNLFKKNLLIHDEELNSGQDFLFHLKMLKSEFKPIIFYDTNVFIRKHKNKIEYHNDKTISKIRIFNYLLKHKKKLNLNYKTCLYIHDKILRSISKMYKLKKRKAITISLLMFFKVYNLKFKIQLLKLIFFGLLIIIFNKGYTKCNINGFYNKHDFS